MHSNAVRILGASADPVIKTVAPVV